MLSLDVPEDFTILHKDKNVSISDNFSFQNNGIKKVHMLEKNAFFFLKQCVF